MKSDLVILLAEDDEGHSTRIKGNLMRAGISNQILSFNDGQEILDFLLIDGPGPHRKPTTPYLLLLDISMPKVGGVQVLEKIKRNPELQKMPIIMLTNADDHREVDRCHRLGCSNYMTKPIDYDKFVHAIRQLGLFLMVTQILQNDDEE